MSVDDRDAVLIEIDFQCMHHGMYDQAVCLGYNKEQPICKENLATHAPGEGLQCLWLSVADVPSGAILQVALRLFKPSTALERYATPEEREQGLLVKSTVNRESLGNLLVDHSLIEQ